MVALGTVPKTWASPESGDVDRWARALAPVAAAHALAIAAAILWTGTHPPAPLPEQPIAVELAPMPVADELATAAATPSAVSPAAVPANATPNAPALSPEPATPPVARTPVAVPVAVPMPASARTAAPPNPAPASAAGNGGSGVAAAAAASGGGAAPGNDAASGRSSGSGAGSSASAGDAGAVWRGRIQRHVDRHKTYPAAARMMKREGRVTLAVTINREGRVLNAAIARGTGFRPIDDEALATLRRAEPLPPPPAELPGASIPMTLPIGFYRPR